jgi:phenylacetate-CoA ligase
MEIQDRAGTLAATISHSANIPFYRARFADILPSLTSFQSPTDLGRLPLLTRDDVRRGFPDAFVPDGLDLPPSFKRGELKIVRSVAGRDRIEWIADAARERELFARVTTAHADLSAIVAARVRRATYFPIPTAGIICLRDLPAMDLRVDTRFDPPLLRLMVPEDPTQPLLSEVRKLFLEIESHGAEWLDVYGTYLALATMTALEEGLPFPQVRLITAGVHSLSARHRRLIEEAWRCPVMAHYGPQELGPFTMYECRERSLHFGEGCWFEVLRNGEPAAPGEIGELVVTSLGHRIPLIRYATGDLVETGTEARCACGSKSGFVRAYAGGKHELVRTGAGDVTAHRIDAVMSAIGRIEQYQVRQERSGRTSIMVRPERGASVEGLAGEVESAVRERLQLTAEVELGRVQQDTMLFEFPLVVTGI